MLVSFAACGVLVAHAPNHFLSTRFSTYTFQQYVKEFGKDYTHERALPAMKEMSHVFKNYTQAGTIAVTKKEMNPTAFVYRESVFYENLGMINAQNADDGSSWLAGVNEFTDLTNDEYRRTWCGNYQRNKIRVEEQMTGRALVGVKKVVTDIDWRQSRGVVTPVKNQGQCGSCWAFSATESLESAFAIQNNEDAPILGPQQIVSCCPIPGAGGCNGGLQTLAFNYTETSGLSTEADYPYTAETGTCDTSKIKPAVINGGFVALHPNDYNQMVSATGIGPVSISVAAGGLGWQFYSSGVFTGGLFGCGFEVDHAVQMVGYGTDSGTMYWLVRNSWGSGWGEQGYIRIERFGDGKEPCGQDRGQTYCGLCGILSDSSYPTEVKAAGS